MFFFFLKKERCLNLNDRQNNNFLWAIRRVKNIYVIQAVKKLYISHLQSHKYLRRFFSSSSFSSLFFSIYNFMSQWDCRYYTGVYTLFLYSQFYICIHNLIQYTCMVDINRHDFFLYNNIRTLYSGYTRSSCIIQYTHIDVLFT